MGLGPGLGTFGDLLHQLGLPNFSVCVCVSVCLCVCVCGCVCVSVCVCVCEPTGCGAQIQ